MVYIALCTDKMIRVAGQMQAQQTEQKGLGHCTSAKSLFTEKRKMVKINTNRSGVALLFKKAKFRNSLRLQSSSARLLPLAVQAFPPLPPPPPTMQAIVIQFIVLLNCTCKGCRRTHLPPW